VIIRSLNSDGGEANSHLTAWSESNEGWNFAGEGWVPKANQENEVRQLATERWEVMLSEPQTADESARTATQF